MKFIIARRFYGFVFILSLEKPYLLTVAFFKTLIVGIGIHFGSVYNSFFTIKIKNVIN